jgi:GAF domain-containing protein/HAMP domain-containing protein
MRRVTTLRRFTVAFAVAALISVGLYLVVYLRLGAWQMLVPGGATLVGLLLVCLAFVLARGGRVDAAGYLVLLAVGIVCVAGELAWANATPYLIATGALLILFAGGALLPRKWGSWLALLGCFGLSILLINQFEPLPRLDIRQSPLLQLYVPTVSALLAAVLIWQGILAYRRVRTIRTRLLILSVATVLLTALAISAGNIIIGFRSGREQALDRLELVASLRQVEIDDWVSDIKDTLAGSLQQAPEHRFVEPEMANVVAALIDTPADSQAYQDTYDFLSYNFEQWLKQAPTFDMVFFMDRDGRVLVSSDPAMEGRVLAEETYFQRGTVGSFLAPPFYDDSLEQVTVFASRPILGEYGRLLGVVAGRVNASTLNRIMRLREQTSLGETGETYMVGEDFSMLTNSRFGELGTRVETEGVRAALEAQEEGSATYVNYQGNQVIGVYRWLPDLQVVLLAEQSRAEALGAVNATVRSSAGIALVAVLIAGAMSLSIARGIGDPLSDLAGVASSIAAGDLERTAQIERQDEIGTLAGAFDTMTSQLRGLIGQLEQRVAQRTQELEIRSSYLEASAEVGHTASTVLDAETLIQTVVDLVHDRFDLYYVGLFLLDEMGDWAELRAGTGQAGQQMLEQKHRLRVGGESMIGQCVARREARIALDVGAEAVRFDNPLLPKTRSEAALPLQSRGRIFGAMTVQSEEAAAFDEDTVTVLQTMADQVAVALDNAYLFTEAEESLKAARRASAEMSREGWAELLRSQPQLGYHSDERGLIRAEAVWRPEMEEAFRAGSTVQLEEERSPGDDRAESTGRRSHPSRTQPLAVPIKVADKVIGVLDTYKPIEAGPWTDAEVKMLESMVEQMAVSLESARLYQQTQSRAAREQMVADITDQLRASLDPDTILKTTVREVGRVLNAELASVELVRSSDGGNGGASPDRGRSTGSEEG